MGSKEENKERKSRQRKRVGSGDGRGVRRAEKAGEALGLTAEVKAEEVAVLQQYNASKAL